MFRKIWYGFWCLFLILAIIFCICTGVWSWLSLNKPVNGPKPAEGYSTVFEQYLDYAEKYAFDEEILLTNDSELKLNFDDFSVLKCVDKEGKVTVKVKSCNSNYILDYSKDDGITNWSDNRFFNFVLTTFLVLFRFGMDCVLCILGIKGCWEEMTW